MRNGQFTDKPQTMTDRFRIEQGQQVGRRARMLQDDGALVDETNMQDAAAKTTILLRTPSISTVFEAAFLSNGFAARADILCRINNGWHLIEVKSATNDKDTYINDMAYTTMVISRCGWTIDEVSLLLVSKEFRLGMDQSALFTQIDHTDDVLNRVEELTPVARQIEDTTKAVEEPPAKLGWQCYICSLRDECSTVGIENHIFDLPHLSEFKFNDLIALGIESIENIPDEFPLSEKQRMVKQAAEEQQVHVADSLSSGLASIEWPAYYLDFETVSTTLPLYPDIAPYAQIPTQYSIHVCSDIGHVDDHREYLADPAKDCRRELAQALIRDLDSNGSIVCYSPFEKRVINQLIRHCPDLSNELEALKARLVDLLQILKRGFYHPGFHGSYSIKDVVPILVPDLSYDGLQIANGKDALAAFAYMAMGKYNQVEQEAIRRDLLEYCKLDTLAMVKLHEELAKYALV